MGSRRGTVHSVCHWISIAGRCYDALDESKSWTCSNHVIISGLVVGFALPFNKALWTPSFTLFTAGLGLLLWVGLRAVWPIIGQNAFAKLAVLMGETALTFYILHMLLLALLVRKLPSDMKIWEVTYGWLTNTGLHGGWAALTYALIAAALCIAPLGLLKRNGWLVKV
jgi:predicted acyltransferase